MSKRQLSLSDDEAQPGEQPTKAIKRAQTENLDHNGTGTPSKKIQSTLTSFFGDKNGKNSKNSNKESTQIEIEEQKSPNGLETKNTNITEIIIESDSDVSYYRYRLLFQKKITMFYSDGVEQPKVKENGTVDLSKKLKDMHNAMFYLNLIQSRPQGDFIDKIHKLWYIFFSFNLGIDDSLIGNMIIKSWKFIMDMCSGCSQISMDQLSIEMRTDCNLKKQRFSEKEKMYI